MPLQNTFYALLVKDVLSPKIKNNMICKRFFKIKDHEMKLRDREGFYSIEKI